MSSKDTNLIWIDLEMTGLNTQTDVIIEIATLITDQALNIIAEGPALAIYQSQEMLNKMDQWNKKQHYKSGLTARVKQSTIDESAAEQATLEFLKTWTVPQRSPMCGNSICQDRRFLARCMPTLEAYFHYRHIDVSTLKELAHRWYPHTLRWQKKSQHLALADIRDSVAELKFYREKFFTPIDSTHVNDHQ